MALPAGAQVRTGAVAGESAAGTGQVGTSLNSGAAASIAPVSGSLAPLSLNGTLAPALAAPAVSLNQGLAPAAALTAAPRAAASSQDAPKAQAAAALPPNTPPGKGPRADSGGGPPPVPPYVDALRKLGVPEEALAELIGAVKPLAARTADALVSMSESETPAKRVLLVLSAALREAEPFAASQLADRIGAKFGFDDKQMFALGQPELFADPADAFPASDKEWAKTWVARLRFAERAALEAARVREKMSRVSGAMAKSLRESAEFGLLPDDIKAALTAGGQPSRGPADGEAGNPAGERAPPADPRALADAASVRKYIAELMGKRVPTARETDSLLGDWLAENEIPVDSARHRAVRAVLLPEKTENETRAGAALPKGLQSRVPLLARLAEERQTTVEALAAMLQRRGLLKAAETMEAEQLAQQVAIGLESEELSDAVAGYPENEAGELLRGVASAMRAKGGKSVEEIARDGVFVYADFAAGRPVRAYATREPDGKTSAMVFYVRRIDGKWTFDGYRQNRRTGSSDATLIEQMRAWLLAGGIPERDLR